MLRSEHPEIAAHGRTNFGPSSYVNAQGKTQPMYRMTADGLSELAMGFSGDKLKATASEATLPIEPSVSLAPYLG